MIFSVAYKVKSHEEDGEFAKVTLRCLGFPTRGVQPAEWSFVIRVPKDKLPQWPLGALVRLEVKE